MRLRRATPLGPGVWGSQSRAGSALHRTLTLRVHTAMPLSMRQGRACGGVCATTKCGAPGCLQRSLSLLRECWRLLEGGVSEAPPTPCPLRRAAALCQPRARVPLREFRKDSSSGDGARCGAPVSVDSCQPCFLGLAGMRDGGGVDLFLMML